MCVEHPQAGCLDVRYNEVLDQHQRQAVELLQHVAKAAVLEVNGRQPVPSSVLPAHPPALTPFPVLASGSPPSLLCI